MPEWAMLFDALKASKGSPGRQAQRDAEKFARKTKNILRNQVFTYIFV